MKIVIYTCILNNYDTPLNVLNFQRPNIDFVCFTDNLEQPYTGWTYHKVSTFIKDDQYKYPKTNRYIKLKPHAFFNQYDINVYIDGNKKIIDFDKLIQLCQVLYNSDANIILSHHWGRNSIIDEAKECIRLKRDDKNILEQQISKYIKDGFKDDIGLYMGSVQIRKFNPETEYFLNSWWSEVAEYSYRDQISLPYVIWKTGMYPKMVRLYPNYLHQIVEHLGHNKQFNIEHYEKIIK